MKIILGSDDPKHLEALRNSRYPFQSITVEINQRQFAGLDPQSKVIAIAKAKSKELLKVFKSNDSVVIVTIHQELVEGQDYPLTAMVYYRPRSDASRAIRYIKVNNTTKLGDFDMTNMRQTLSVLGFQFARAA